MKISSIQTEGAQVPTVIEAHHTAQCVLTKDDASVGRGRVSRYAALFLRRIKYIARFVFWTVRHRSTEHVRWVLAVEGFTWN